MQRTIALQLRRVSLVTKALVLATVGITPMLLSSTASAAPALLSRQLTSTTARPGQATQLAWTFNTTADTANAKQIEIEFCDSPLGTCNVVNTPALSNTPAATLTGPWTTGTVTSTARDATSDSGGANTQFTIVKTNADDATSKTGLIITLGASDVTNNGTANKSYYTRVRVYSDTGTTLKWEGVFAQSTSQTLTVNARVQERLDFCVGSTAVNDATTSTAADCSAVTGNSVDIGNIESGFTNVSPVSTTNGGTNENGLAMIRTNAVNGAVVDYKSVQNSSSGQLKVPGATCVSLVTTTDQCFNSSTTQGTFTAGTENFGMTIAGINCGSTSSYICTFGSGTYNLVRDAAYDGDGTNTYVADNDHVPSTTAAQYAWQDNGTATRIASSAGSSVKVIDDEAMVLKFAATAGVTTPTGSYSVQSDFIATATF